MYIIISKYLENADELFDGIVKYCFISEQPGDVEISAFISSLSNLAFYSGEIKGKNYARESFHGLCIVLFVRDCLGDADTLAFICFIVFVFIFTFCNSKIRRGTTLSSFDATDSSPKLAKELSELWEEDGEWRNVEEL